MSLRKLRDNQGEFYFQVRVFFLGLLYSRLFIYLVKVEVFFVRDFYLLQRNFSRKYLCVLSSLLFLFIVCTG